MKPQSTVITLEIQGKMYLRRIGPRMNQRHDQGQSDFVFVIGDQTACTRTSYNAVTTHYHSAK
ncbi:hypothetical protein [Staphylococcus aureus]|uniref:hypothetical protein n=1 Tax=Staphylococcus aureus TaxID=1280 RepID=UPI0021632DD8|nr:hypothetical protein [Staphylococcus aureus]